LEETTRPFERDWRWTRCRREVGQVFVVRHDVPFRNREVPVEDVQQLAFHSPNIFFREGAGPPSPSRVFDGVIRHVLRSQDEGADQNPLACPPFVRYLELRSRSFDVYEGDEDYRNVHS